MDWVKEGTQVIDHPKFLEAGPIARDLWEWGMKYSGKHELDGELPMVAVLSSAWGAGGSGNIVPAQQLVEIGLWERTDAGFRILRWEEQGNLTRAQIAEGREAARSRMKRRRSDPPPPLAGCSLDVRANFDVRSPELLANERRTNADVPTSTSPSDLGSGSLEPDLVQASQVTTPRAREPAFEIPPEPESRVVAIEPWTLDTPIPDAWRVDADGQITPTGETVDVAEQWRRYLADRLRPDQRKLVSGADWRGWILGAIGFARRDRQRESDMRARAGPRRGRDIVQAAVPGAWKVPEAMP